MRPKPTMTIFFFIFRLTILSGVSSCGTCHCVRAVRGPEVRAAVSPYAGGGQHPSAAGDGFFYRGRSAALRSVLLFRLRASSFLHAQKGTKDALKNRMVLKDLLSWCPEGGCRTPRRIKIAWTLSRLLPPPGGDRFPGAPDGKAPHCGGALRAAPRPSPLEKGAVAAKGGDWGFLASCRDRGEGPTQRNPPSRLRRATSLFKGGFWRAGNVRPYEGARRGRRAPRMGSSIPKPCPRTDGVQRRGCRGIGQTLRSSTRSPSRRPNAESLRSPLHRSARWQVPRQAHFAGADGPDHRSSQAPVGRERERAPFDPLAPIVAAGLPLRVPRPPSMGVLRGSGA